MIIGTWYIYVVETEKGALLLMEVYGQRDTEVMWQAITGKLRIETFMETASIQIEEFYCVLV